MSMRFLHSADIHFRRETQEQALASLDGRWLRLRSGRSPRSWRSPAISSTAACRTARHRGFPRLLAVIQRILDVCPIAAVSGTPTHDLPGCYEALTKLPGRRITTSS